MRGCPRKSGAASLSGVGCPHGRGININPRDFKKAAPYLGALLVLAVVIFIFDSFLL